MIKSPYLNSKTRSMSNKPSSIKVAPNTEQQYLSGNQRTQIIKLSKQKIQQQHKPSLSSLITSYLSQSKKEPEIIILKPALNLKMINLYRKNENIKLVTIKQLKEHPKFPAITFNQLNSSSIELILSFLTFSELGALANTNLKCRSSVKQFFNSFSFEDKVGYIKQYSLNQDLIYNSISMYFSFRIDILNNQSQFLNELKTQREYFEESFKFQEFNLKNREKAVTITQQIIDQGIIKVFPDIFGSSRLIVKRQVSYFNPSRFNSQAIKLQCFQYFSLFEKFMKVLEIFEFLRKPFQKCLFFKDIQTSQQTQRKILKFSHWFYFKFNQKKISSEMILYSYNSKSVLNLLSKNCLTYILSFLTIGSIESVKFTSKSMNLIVRQVFPNILIPIESYLNNILSFLKLSKLDFNQLLDKVHFDYLKYFCHNLSEKGYIYPKQIEIIVKFLRYLKLNHDLKDKKNSLQSFLFNPSDSDEEDEIDYFLKDVPLVQSNEMLLKLRSLNERMISIKQIYLNSKLIEMKGVFYDYLFQAAKHKYTLLGILKRNRDFIPMFELSDLVIHSFLIKNKN